MKYRIVTDGSCDLPENVCRKNCLTVVPFYVSFDSQNYYKEIEEMPIREFYDKMVADGRTFPKSSMPSVQDYADAFLPIVEAGEAIICICITTKFSGSFQSADNARRMILEEHPDARITVIDSTINTVLQGIYVLEAAKMCAAGIPYEDAIAELERIKESGRIFFTVGSLDYLEHGGRIGKLSGLAGSLLKIRPIITLKEGEIFSSGIARGRKKSLDKVRELLLSYIKENPLPIDKYRLCIGYGYDIEEGKEFQKDAVAFLNENGYEVTADDLPIYQIGATISVHTGPYPLGFGILLRNQLS